MPTEAAAVPSINESIAAELAKIAPAGAADKLKPQAPEGKTEAPPAKTEPEKPKVFKSLAEAASAMTDTLPEEPKTTTEPKTTDDADPDRKSGPDGRNEGESTSAFIKRMKSELADARNKLKQTEGRKSEATPDEIAALRAEIAERDSLIEQTAFEKSKAFRTQFSEPLTKAEEAAKKHIGKFTSERGVYEQAMQLDGKECLEFLEEKMGGTAAAMAYQQIESVRLAQEAKAAAMSSAEERAKALREESENSATNEILRDFDGQRDDFSKRLSIFRGEEGDNLEQQARALLTGDAPREDIIAAARYAVALPHYLQLLQASQKTIAELKARIAASDGDHPTINGLGADAVKNRGAIQDGKLPSIGDAIAATLAARK